METMVPQHPHMSLPFSIARREKIPFNGPDIGSPENSLGGATYVMPITLPHGDTSNSVAITTNLLSVENMETSLSDMNAQSHEVLMLTPYLQQTCLTPALWYHMLRGWIMGWRLEQMGSHLIGGVSNTMLTLVWCPLSAKLPRLAVPCHTTQAHRHRLYPH